LPGSSDIGHKVNHQLSWVDEAVRFFAVAKVFVVAFATLVVVTHDTLSVYDVDQPVFVGMFGWGYRLRNLPDDDFDKAGAVSIFLTVRLNEDRLLRIESVR